MGTVYRAESDGESYAVKEMRDSFTDPQNRQDAINRFMAEALMLARLSHPHIPQVHRHFIENDRYFLVMDFVEGEDLQVVLDREGNPGLPEEQVLNWALQICSVLEYLHSQSPPVIFRDLKPSNIILKPSGDICLIDFGIAKLFNPARQGTLIGTPGYAAPEQYQGLADPRSDIFALGATLHHLLTGRDPRKGSPFIFPSLTALNPTTTSELDVVVQKALEMKPDERWASIQNIRQTLNSLAKPRKDTGVQFTPLPSGALLAARQYEVVQVINKSPKLNAYLVQDRRHRYCSKCGSVSSKVDAEYCNECGASFTGGPVEHPGYLLRETPDRDLLAQEARIAELGLQHDGIVNLHHAFEERPYHPHTRFYVVSDPDEGNSLANIPRPQPEEQVLAWCAQLAEALAYLHDNGVLHRNIRPENVRIVDSQIKLTNFGLSEKAPKAVPKEWFAKDVEALCRTMYSLLDQDTVSPVVATIFNKAQSPVSGERYKTVEALIADLSYVLGP